ERPGGLRLRGRTDGDLLPSPPQAVTRPTERPTARIVFIGRLSHGQPCPWHGGPMDVTDPDRPISMISKRLLLIVGLTLGLATAACGGKNGGGAVEYSVSAQKNYDKGLKELDSKDW